MATFCDEQGRGTVTNRATMSVRFYCSFSGVVPQIVPTLKVVLSSLACCKHEWRKRIRQCRPSLRQIKSRYGMLLNKIELCQKYIHATAAKTKGTSVHLTPLYRLDRHKNIWYISSLKSFIRKSAQALWKALIETGKENSGGLDHVSFIQNIAYIKVFGDRSASPCRLFDPSLDVNDTII
jgi:hypothetical protein